MTDSEFHTSSKSINGTPINVGFRASSFCASSGCVEVGFRASSFCGGGACVEVNTTVDQVLVRDSKNTGGPVLSFTADEWRDFLTGVWAGEFDV